MRIRILLTPSALGGDRLQAVLETRREYLAARGHLYASAPGKRNHTRLFMAATDPDHVDPLRAARGYTAPEQQQHLRELVRQELVLEVEKARPQTLILAATQLVPSLTRASELARLRDILAPLSDDIGLVLHVDEPARTLARVHAAQVMAGRSDSLAKELALTDWAAQALGGQSAADPRLNRFAEIHAAPHWLDYAHLVDRWEAAFGPGSIRLRPCAADGFAGPETGAELAAAFDLPDPGPADPARPDPAPSDAWLARARQVNALFDRLRATGRIIPPALLARLIDDLEVPGPPIAPGSLSPVSRALAPACDRLVARDASLAAALTPDPPLPDWTEPDPGFGFRATQYLAAFLPRIDAATAEVISAAVERTRRRKGRPVPTISPEAEAILPPLAKAQFAAHAAGRFAPHNDLGRVREAEAAPPYPAVSIPKPRKGSSGNVIVGCMKNEGPYIVEWIAYHRAIGVHDFLIYTNGCEDGTDAILDRLQAMGIAQHRNNDEWKGKSPQQAALNKSLKEPVIRNADWIIHIDVDEFMNIRTGDGTLPALFAAAPDATAVAMTWRLFGHGGVTEFKDQPVIAQFTRCAPSYCPKPHTVWGFKTMFRNDGAYAKFSCHRPNKLDPAKKAAVKWVNGSGLPMADELKEKGWRNGIDDIGYDLIQLNHYALRSADSFLVKRQRGRALHVDRSIGLNYWIRMDWSDATDVTIQRNLPRLRAEMDRLLADPELKRLHEKAVAWHRARATELHANPEFQELYDQALATRLNGMERVAYSLALDLES
jgi:hypothetical protein